MDSSIVQQVSPNNSALSAEHYQTYEMAKANDDILSGNDIAQIRSYAAYARAQAQAIHKTIAATSGIDDVAAIKAEATETAQTFAKVGIYADQRIGEILRELPTGHGNRFSDTSETLKADAIKDVGIPKSQAYDLQAMAANPEVVQAVLDKAEAEGRIVSRKQVLDAIKRQKQAEQERDQARNDLQDAYLANENMDAQLASYQKQMNEALSEIASLEKQNDELYAQKNPEPKVVEREVVREVESEASKRRIHELEHLERIHSDDNQKLRRHIEELRKELDRAKGILRMDKGTKDVQRDVEYLISSTNQYVRQYGGLTWTFERIAEVDDVTREELRKAVTNLATFSNALVASLEQMQ